MSKKKIKKILLKPFVWVWKKLKINKRTKYVTYKYLFPWIYRHHAKKPVNPKKVVFVEPRYDVLSDSYQLLYDKLEKEGYELHVSYLRNIIPGYQAYMRRCVAMIKLVADASYVFLNDSNDVFSTLPLRKETRTANVWHACGAFKKFGMSTAEKIFGASQETLEKYPNYKNLELVTVSSPEIIWAYEEAMNLKHEDHIVRATGVSRTDVFFDPEFIAGARQKVLEVFPEIGDRKIILYAPTFRGRTKSAKTPNCLDIAAFAEHFSKDYVLLLKHHPMVKKRPRVPEEYQDFAMDVTKTLNIDTLLCVSDICISDYSSLIYEYSLFERPMIFYAFDLDDYFDWRGFYYNYDELTPGPIFKTNEEMIEYIEHIDERFDRDEVVAFRKKFMGACDGHATERIWHEMQKSSKAVRRAARAK